MNKLLITLILLALGIVIGVAIERRSSRNLKPPIDPALFTEAMHNGMKQRGLKVVRVAPTIDDLLDAIEWVESKGEADAVGQAGEIGAYQLTKQYVDDVNRILGEELFTYADRYDKAKSRLMTRTYIIYYVPIMNRTLESRARIHNAGPDGYQNDPRWFVRNREYILEDAVTKINNSIAYWEKVKAELDADMAEVFREFGGGDK